MSKHTGFTATSQIDFSGTTHAGLKLNSLTTTQRDALTPGAGMMIYNSTTTTVQKYQGGAWSDVSASSAGSTQSKISVVVGPTGDTGYATDGTADNIQIQAAIDAVGAAGGGAVTLQAGTYAIASRIVVSFNNITVTGAGRGITTLTAGFDGAALGGHQGIFLCKNLDNVTPVSNFRVAHMSFNLNSLPTPAIQVKGTGNGTTSKNFHFHDLEIYGRGIDATGSLGALTFFGNYSSFTGPIHNITLERIEIRDGLVTTLAKPSAESILFLSHGMNNVKIRNCHFHDVYSNTIRKVGGTVLNSRAWTDWVLDSCSFINTVRTNWGGESTFDFYDNRYGFTGIKITNNYFERVDGIDADDRYFLGVYDAQGLIIDHNIFKNARTVWAPGHSVPDGYESRGWTFTNNIILGGYSLLDPDGNFVGTFSNNVIFGLQHSPAFGGYGRHTPTLVQGNLIANTPSNPETSLEYTQGVFLTENGGVVFQDNVVYNDTALTAPGAPTVADSGIAGTLNGTYLYKITYFAESYGETEGGAASVSQAVTNKKINLSNVPIGPSGTTSRAIYRTTGSGSNYFLVNVLENNTTTTYTDNIADSALGPAMPTVNTTGNKAKYTFFEQYGPTPNGIPNVYRDNTVMGASPSTKSFVLDSAFKHTIMGNTGIVESSLQNTYASGVSSVTSLASTDIATDNFKSNGTRLADNNANIIALVNKTANYTLTATDDVITADASAGAFTLTLPTAVGIAGRIYRAKKTDSSANAVTIATTSSQTIDGVTTFLLVDQNDTLSVISNGANWLII